MKETQISELPECLCLLVKIFLKLHCTYPFLRLGIGEPQTQRQLGGHRAPLLTTLPPGGPGIGGTYAADTQLYPVRSQHLRGSGQFSCRRLGKPLWEQVWPWVGGEGQKENLGATWGFSPTDLWALPWWVHQHPSWGTKSRLVEEKNK